MEEAKVSKIIDTTVDVWLEKVKALYEKDHKLDEFKREEPFLKIYLAKLQDEQKPSGMLSICKLDEPLARGGTGIVFKASHSRIQNQKFALKFNRPRVEGDTQQLIENELEVLPLMDNFNVIRAIDVGKLSITGVLNCPSLCFILEPLIADAKSLTKYVEKIAQFDGEINDSLLDNALTDLAKAVRQWVFALAYIHKMGYVYLDVKPDNVVVDKDGHLLIIDFGTAVKIDPEDHTPTPVYFSYPYAHPKIKKLAEKSSTNRVRASIKKSQLTCELDYYALGKSIIELLEKISTHHPHDFPQRPLFQSLYFLATRLLDGQNTNDPANKGSLSEVFRGLTEEDYATIKYLTLDDVGIDIDKEIGNWNIENEVPELETFPASTIRVVPELNTALTDRLVDLIEHPLLARLKMVSQLGLVTMVYPTADHSRYDHILGAYTYSRYYISALYNDSQNCIFRNLVNEKDIKASLLAALLHDLGQYPLAHDLQEVQSKIFDHSRISMDLLNDSTQDKKGRTIKDIIQNNDKGWELDIERITRILGAHSGQVRLAESHTVQDFKADMLSALIDGPIDADKADYIIRDSTNARIPYGQQLDVDRLLSVLTTARIPGKQSHKVTIGVYEKGVASASAFSLARYLLYASIYWHHTSRVLKAMLQYGTVLTLPKEVFNDYPDERRIEEIHGKLLDFIKTNLIPPMDQLAKDNSLRIDQSKEKMDIGSEPNDEAMEEIMKNGKAGCTDWYPGLCRTDWLMLNWIKGLATNENNRGVALIDQILKRDLYKRVLTIPDEDASGDNAKLIKRCHELKWLGKVRLSESIQKMVYERIQKKAKSVDTMLYPDGNVVETIFRNNLAIIIDIPDHKKFSSDRPLIYVPELQHKTYYRDEPAQSHNLSNALESLVKTVSPVRILCHPSVRQWIGACIEPEEFRNIVLTAADI